MAFSRRSSRRESVNFWPGFIDALSTLLLVFIFLLTVFMFAQFFLTQEISGRDSVLDRLRGQLSELTQMLALEKGNSASLTDTISSLSLSLADAESEKTKLAGLLAAYSAEKNQSGSAINVLNDKLTAESRIKSEALAQVELLNLQIASLRRQIATVSAILDAAEQKDKNNQVKIANLGQRLNLALAQKVQQLSKYRSNFFGRLREILAKRSDVKIVGDRFVFQSEVLFSKGRVEINDQGKTELVKIAEAIIEISTEIPDDINWVLRVDGHTDSTPIKSSSFASNWELSAARSISVVRTLIEAGVPPRRLMAAGFGEHHPLAEGDSDEAKEINRRIELKLTEK
ncbi:MAG: peptidoglycan -binding protein [Rhizobiales bacterium]|nr:peptidoglycan -binding protein [Hyphomicrobiales bacterium]NRB14180.1 peptidoglycan -binding protein [Hyphomicrobiales bacterium]